MKHNVWKLWDEKLAGDTDHFHFSYYLNCMPLKERSLQFKPIVPRNVIILGQKADKHGTESLNNSLESYLEVVFEEYAHIVSIQIQP